MRGVSWHAHVRVKTLFCNIKGRDRTNYLLVKEAKIIAMTCTHAALKRRDLVELGFKVCVCVCVCVCVFFFF